MEGVLQHRCLQWSQLRDIYTAESPAPRSRLSVGGLHQPSLSHLVTALPDPTSLTPEWSSIMEVLPGTIQNGTLSSRFVSERPPTQRGTNLQLGRVSFSTLCPGQKSSVYLWTPRKDPMISIRSSLEASYPA